MYINKTASINRLQCTGNIYNTSSGNIVYVTVFQAQLYKSLLSVMIIPMLDVPIILHTCFIFLNTPIIIGRIMTSWIFAVWRKLAFISVFLCGVLFKMSQYFMRVNVHRDAYAGMVVYSYVFRPQKSLKDFTPIIHFLRVQLYHRQ
jgi:hypothetical protein